MILDGTNALCGSSKETLHWIMVTDVTFQTSTNTQTSVKAKVQSFWTESQISTCCFGEENQYTEARKQAIKTPIHSSCGYKRKWGLKAYGVKETGQMGDVESHQALWYCGYKTQNWVKMRGWQTVCRHYPSAMWINGDLTHKNIWGWGQAKERGDRISFHGPFVFINGKNL